jgi:hypothetical protein
LLCSSLLLIVKQFWRRDASGRESLTFTCRAMVFV